MSLQGLVAGGQQTYYIPSLSSALMAGVTNWRNLHNNCDIKTKAEFGYALIVSIALIESVVAALFCIAACLLLPISSRPLKNTYEWLKSSAFCIIWSIVSCLLNPCVEKLVDYEGDARGYQGFKFIQ